MGGSIISLHPDHEVRQYYVEWFKGMADIAGDLGAPAIGTQFGIFTFKDYDDLERRAELMKIALDCWADVAEHAKARGLTWAVLGAHVGWPRAWPHAEGHTRPAGLDRCGRALPFH
jgi:sugar phosphate isomerase/epimerase